MKKKELFTVDLFCGAGGATSGLEYSLNVLGMTHKGLAINHWEIAVDTMRKNHAVVTPFVFDNANGGVQIGGGPLNTITTKDNHMAAFPVLEDGRVIDIRIRMLKPEELAAAHSFPADYILTGNRGEKVKQIGNSVPVMTAAAMCYADLAK